MKYFFALLAGMLLAGSAAADTVLFSFQKVQTAASNDVIRAQHFLEQTALNATTKCLDEGLFARKYWIAAANELKALGTATELWPSALRKALSSDNLPHDRNSEVMMGILLNAHESLYNEFYTQRRTPEVDRAFVESLRKGISAALQARTMLTDASPAPGN